MNYNKQNADSLLSLIGKCLEYAKAQAGKLSTALGINRQRQASLCLYSQILGLVSDILILHKSEKCCVGIPILLRSVLEAVADLKILSEDSNHLHVMQATSLKQQLKMGQAAKKHPNNPMLKTIQSNSDAFQCQLGTLQKGLNHLNSKGYKSLEVWEKFDKAKMFEEYESIYSLFCDDTHANLGALLRRHSDTANKCSPPGLSPVSLKDSIPGMALSLELLIISSKIIHALFATGETFEDLEKENDVVMEMIVSGTNNIEDLQEN